MILFSLIYMFLFINENATVPYTLEEIWPVGLGSFLMVFAVILTNFALAYGKAGPSQALF